MLTPIIDAHSVFSMMVKWSKVVLMSMRFVPFVMCHEYSITGNELRIVKAFT